MAAFEKKGKKNLAILVVLRKKMSLLQESNWSDSAHQKNIDIFTLGIHCKCGYQICQDFSGSFDAHIHIPSFPQKVTDWLQKHILNLFYLKKTVTVLGYLTYRIVASSKAHY